MGIVPYSNFGLTYNRMRIVPVEQFRGSRQVWKKTMNIYQLEYNFKGALTGITKRRSYFYRPEHIENRDLWSEIKNGRAVLTLEDVHSGEELDLLRKAQTQSKAKLKYR